MKQDEIIELAMNSGLPSKEAAQHQLWWLEAFAKLVAAAAASKEREACAQVCDDINAVYSKPEDAAERVASQWCAERIRARGEA